MNIKKQINKINKVNPFGLLAIGLIVGVAIMYLYFQPKLAYQEKTTKDLAKTVKANQVYADLARVVLELQLASASAEIKTLLSRPPQIEYQTKYVQTPAQNIPQEPRLPVTYNSYGGDVLYGSDGSTCNTYGGNIVYCSGGR